MQLEDGLCQKHLLANANNAQRVEEQWVDLLSLVTAIGTGRLGQLCGDNVPEVALEFVADLREVLEHGASSVEPSQPTPHSFLVSTL